VAGVQPASRQHSAPEPFFQTSVPSPLRQLSAELDCAKTASGAVKAADANSTATLLSFFIGSPLRGIAAVACEIPNRKRENLANTRFCERSPPTAKIVP
jgi:hypothetical protein